MKKNIFDKSLFAIRMLIVVLCVICGAVPAWAGHGGPHYASVSVTASPTANGKVYMTTDKDYAPGSEDWQGSMSDTWNCDDGIGSSEEDTRTYYVHAQAESGYHFAKWSSNSSGTDSKSTANPYPYSTSASSTSSGSPTQNNIYAIFEANPQYTCTFLTSTNGTYKYLYGDHEEVTVTSEHPVTTDQNFTFTALPDPGYQVYGWYTESGGVKTYFDYSSYVLSSYALPGNISIGVDFMPVGSPIFQIKGTNQMFTDLNAAVSACGGATKTIVLVNNGTLPAGEYTIPSNVTLLIPFDANYTCYTETPGTIDSYTSPAAYRTLTMSPGARLIVNGKISLSAKVSGLDVQGPNGVASGPYGAIKMLSKGFAKSTITLNNGGKLYCWGYIYGEGEVEALSGAEVHEGFNFMDFRGAQNTYDMNSDSHKVFPFNQYYIQNIEVPLTIHYGATEKVFSCLYPGGNEVKIPIIMVGSSDGLFRLTASGAKLTKWYDPHDDRQHYALEGNAAIRNISFTVTLIMSITVNSANFVLPITNNMDIEVRSGANVDISENVCIMPDASITVEEGATLNIASGKNVYVYDKNAYTNAGTYTTDRGGYPDAGPGRYALGKYIRSVNYSPSWATIPDREIRRLAILHTARFKINGTVNVNGSLYTTEGGADIYSDTDGAVINLSTAAGTANVTYQVDHHGYDAYYYSIPITSAQLHNADQSYAPTAGSPAGASWTYKHGHWGWKVVWMLEDGTVLKTAYHYAQPDASWLSSNAPSTSRDPEGTCSYSFNGWNTTTNTANQEVTVVADYTKTCTDYYTITWKSEDGTETLETDAGVGDGENTRYNGATPFKPFDTESSRLYTFDGWATEPNGEKVYDIDGTPAASGDAIYYAHFAVTEVVAIVKADDDTTYCTSIEAAFEVVRNTNFTPTIQVWKDASIPALVYNIENYCTLDLNGHTLTSVTSSVQSPFKINKSNITFTITDSSESQSGKLSMTSTYGSTIFGLFVQNGNLQLNGGTIEVISGSAIACGVSVNSNCSFTMNGGKIHVVTTNNKEGRGVYSAGTVLINDGTVHVEAAGNACAIKRDGGTFTINNGKFNINGSASYINYGASADANIAIKGGYYTTNNRLATVVPSPYFVYDWASPGEPYHYTVAAKVGYTVTFQNTDETTLQTGTWVEGTTPAYAGETPTKPGDIEGAWMLGGWTPDLVPVTEDVTYTAVYVPTPPVASVTISGTTTEYIHFADAWTAVNSASAASTIKLLDDVALASMLTFTSGRNCTFDLNGYTITNTDLVMFNLNKASSTFTLTDGSEGQTGKVVVRSNGTSVAYGVLVSKGTFVLHAGTIESYLQANTSQGVRVANGASFTMEGGTIDVMTTNAQNGDGVFANTTGSATITGGTIRVRAAATGYAVNSVGTVTVTGGHFDAAGGTSAACVAGSPTLQGGYYNINTNLSANTSAPYYVFPNADETYLYKVSAGYTLTWSTDGVLSGEGYTPSGLTEVGTPIVAPTSTKEGYVFAGWTPAVAATMPAANTTYTAQWAVASVTIGETTTLYTTFDATWNDVNSASAASTLKLLQNVSITSCVAYNNSYTQNCTLDLNGHEISGSATPLLQITQSGITFTITDLTEAKEGRIECNTHINGQKWAVEVSKSTLRFEGGTIYAKNTQAGTLFIGIYSGTSGVIEMSGGNIHTVTTANNPTYGVLTFGTATISSGSIQVEAAGTGYAVEARNSKSNVTITGGYFYATGSSVACVHTEGSEASLTLQGGYYNSDTNLETCVTSPYHVLPNDDATYLYKVAEGYTVTFNNYDGTSLQSGVWEKGATPEYGGETPTKPADAHYTYTFDTWSPAISSVTANATYTATYNSTVNNYTVTIAKNVDGYGSISATEVASVPYGSTITVAGNTFTVNGTTVTATPETSDAQYTYTFDGWTNAPETVTGNVTITANFTRTTNTYTVLWKDEDGTTLETDENVSYGTTPTYDGATPTKPADASYAYTFDDWSPAVGAITGNTEYTATYSTTPVVTSVTENEVTDYYTTFDAAWTAATGAGYAATITLLDDVTGLSASRTYSAAHDLTLDLNGHTLSGSSTDASLFQINSTGHTFTVTDGSADKEGKISFTAIGSANSYCVMVNNGTFVLNAGKLYAESASNNGVIGCVQSNGGTFTMNENGALHAKYTGSAKNGRAVHANGGTTTINGGTIRVESKTDGMGFVYVKGSVVTVNGGRFKITASGTAAVTNQNAGNAILNIRGGYYSANNNTYFTPHVKAPYHIFSNSDAEYPQKVAEGYTVTFNNYDGTSLHSGLWEKGTTPTYSGETPTKPADAYYTYTFDTWSPAISSVTANATYTATFTETVNTYTVTWKDEDGTILETDENVPYGTTPTYDGATPTKPADEEYVYTFNGWDPAVGPITSNTEYTATYTTTPVVTSVTISGVTTYYTAFEGTGNAWSAANNATSPSTIKLLKDITATSILTYNNSNTQDCTLDLNGHTISSTQQAVLNPTKAGITFTLTDHSENHNGKLLSNATATNAAYGILVSAGTFVMENGTIEAHLPASTSQGVRVANGASFTMNGGTIEVETTNSKNGDGVFANTTGTATIHGGEIRVHAAATGYAVNVAGTTTITGGKFSASGSSSACIHKASGTLTLQGGYYSTDTNLDAYCATNYHVFPNDDATYIYKVAEGYTVTFQNGEEVLQSETLEKGAMPEYTGAMPTKPEDAQYTYAFSGWDPEVVAVTANAIYTAQFSPTTKTYTVTWKDADGSTLRIDDNVPYGTMPSYGSTPTKATDEEYVYTFAGWTPDLSSVTGDVTYTASYNTTPVVASVMNNSSGYTLYYTDFDDAFTAAKEATVAVTITLLQDVSSSVLQYSGKNTDCTLDLNGHTFTSTATQLILNVNKEGSTFTITDKTESKLGQMRIVSTRTDEAYGVYIRSGHLILEAGTIYASLAAATCAGVRAVNANSSFTMNGGTIQLVTTNSNDGYGIMRTGGTVMVNDGKLNISASGSAYVTNQANNTYVKIYGGYYNIDSNLSSVCATNYHVFPNSDATYRYKVAEGYTVTFNNYDGTALQTGLWEKNTTPVYSGDTPTKPEDAQYTYAFSGWDPEVVDVKDDATYIATYTATPKTQESIVVNEGETTTIDVNTETTTTIVHVSGTLEVAENVTLTTNDLILEATPSSSGEILGDVAVNQNAYFDLSQPGGFKAKTWYAVAVPWSVSVTAYKNDNGVYIKNGSDDPIRQTMGTTFDLIYYDGERRASGDTKAWNYVEDDQTKDKKHYTMEPGRAYMIYLTSEADVIRFEMTGDDLHTTSIEAHTYSSGNETLANWNGIANPATYHAYLNVGATEGRGQVYNGDTKQYEMFDMSANKLVVGQPIFVQSTVEGTVVANSNTYVNPSTPAPRRVKEAMTPFSRYEFILAPSEADETDRIIVRMSEDKEENNYVVGQDLVKMGVSDRVPQMWINRYDCKMCINTEAPVNNTADYPLGISVQKDGEYDMFIDNQPDDNTMLYLTYDGEAIWNLCYGGYVASLNKGTNTHYGLRIVYAPQTATGMENVQNDNVQCTKVLMDDHVFIIRGGNIYTMDGQLVK